MLDELLKFSVKEVAVGILLSVLVIGGGVAAVVAFVPRSAGGELAPPAPPVVPPVVAETATVTVPVPPVVAPPVIAETGAVVIPPVLPIQPVVSSEPQPDRFSLTARTGGVIYSASDGTILPLGGFVSDTGNLYADGYANLDKIGFVHSDNPNVSFDGTAVLYSATGAADETVTITVGSAVGGVTKEVAISYRVVVRDVSFDSLVQSAIAELNVADEYKVALRALPRDLNPFYVNGVSNVSIGNIEEAAAVFDRVKNSDKFGWRELSADEQRKLERGVVALTGVVHFNEQVLDYSRADINRVLHDLDIWTDTGFFTREFEPAWELSNREYCEEGSSRRFTFTALFDGDTEYKPFFCFDEKLYELSSKGEEYYNIVNKDASFYWSRLLEHFATLSIINNNGGTVEDIKEKNNERFNILFDNYSIRDVRNGISRGIGWSYGNINSVNERTLDSGLVVNSYNAVRNVLVYERESSLEELNVVSATHELLEWLRSVNFHFGGIQNINDYNLPGANTGYQDIEEIQALISASPNYFSWPSSVNLVIPGNKGGIDRVGSTMISGGIPSLIRLLGVSSEQIFTVSTINPIISKEEFNNLPENNAFKLGRPLNLIKYDFSELGVKWSEGNLTVSHTQYDEYNYDFACQATVDLEDLNFYEGFTRKNFSNPINENPVCNYLGITQD